MIRARPLTMTIPYLESSTGATSRGRARRIGFSRGRTSFDHYGCRLRQDQHAAHRVAHLIVNGADPHRVMLLTFSRRAAGEMIRRVERIMANVMRERTAAMTDAIVWAGTFHSVGARLLRESQHESLSAPIPRLVLNHKHVVSNASRERAKGNLCHAGRPSHGYQPTRLRPGASGSGTVIVDRPQSSSACRSTAGGS
jgi:hypothetical protein